MKLVADESLDGAIIQRLRRDGHTLISIAEMQPGIEDTDVLVISRNEAAMLLTADKDFGDLVFRQRLLHRGILLVRLEGLSPSQKAELVSGAMTTHGHEMNGSFAVLTRDSLRIRKSLKSDPQTP